MTRDERLAFQTRMDELSLTLSIDPLNEGKNEGTTKGARVWERLQATATPGIDTSGQAVLQLRVGDDLAQVGISRANILSVSDSSELAARLLEARLHQELRPPVARKTSARDVERDLELFQYLLSLQPREAAVTPSSTNDRRIPARASLQQPSFFSGLRISFTVDNPTAFIIGVVGVIANGSGIPLESKPWDHTQFGCEPS